MKVLVLGAGVIGVSTAYYLVKHGFEVTLVERQQAVAQETSYANAGQISPGYATPWAAPGVPKRAFKWLFQQHAPLAIRLTNDAHQYRWMWQMLMNCSATRYAVNKERMLRLAEYSRDCLDELRRTTGIQYAGRQRGLTQLFRTEQQLDEAILDMAVLDESGVPYRLLQRHEIAEVEPALAHSPTQLAGALHLPNDQTGDCYLFTVQLAEMAQAAGVEFRFDHHVNSLMTEGDAVQGVYINGELERADYYIVAMGSESRLLLEPAGIDLPVYPLKGYSLTYPVLSDEAAPQATVLDETYKVAVTRLDDRVRVGGMAELAGYDHRLNDKRRQTLTMVVNTLYPEAGDSSQAEFWTGLRPATPDGTPIVGPTAYRNLFLNTGHGTLGWTMACGSAQYLTDLLAKQPTRISGEGLDIFRYRERSVF